MMVDSLNTQRWVYVEMVFTAKKHKSIENIQKYTKRGATHQPPNSNSVLI